VTLVVYGATGATGRRVIGLASAAGVPVIAVGRRADALATLDVSSRVATTDSAELDAAFAGATVVVSCAGPYTHLGPPVLAAAIRAGASYVDCAGEPRWVARITEEFERDAVAAGVAVVPSLGLGVATDLACGFAAEQVGGADAVTRLLCAVRIVGMRPSVATTRSTVELVAGGAPVVDPGSIGWQLAGTRVHRFATGRGALFTAPDAIVLARSYRNAHIECHAQPALVGAGLAAGGALWQLPGTLAATRKLLSRLRTRADHAGGGRSRVTVEALGQGRTVTVTGEADDIYDVTGRGAFAVARALLNGAGERTGLRNAGQFLGAPQQAADDLDVRLEATLTD
jgi:Saccharopine dehydrogenase NADP binding domain